MYDISKLDDSELEMLERLLLKASGQLDGGVTTSRRRRGGKPGERGRVSFEIGTDSANGRPRALNLQLI
jgi:hypothetical protein